LEGFYSATAATRPTVAVARLSFGCGLWLSSTSAPAQIVLQCVPVCVQGPAEGITMKKVLIALVATLVAVSVSGCVGIGKGKGKAPPPIVTKG